MNKIIFTVLATLITTTCMATEKVTKVDRAVAAQGQYICAIKSVTTSGSTNPVTQVRNYLNNFCDSDKPYSITSGEQNNYLVCCVSK